MVWFGSISVSLACSYLGWDKHTKKKKRKNLTHRMVYRVAAQLKNILSGVQKTGMATHGSRNPVYFSVFGQIRFYFSADDLAAAGLFLPAKLERGG